MQTQPSDFFSRSVAAIPPGRTHVSEAVAAIHQLVATSGLDSEVTLIIAPGQLTLRGNPGREEQPSLRVTVPAEVVLSGNVRAFAERFLEAYREFKAWQ